MNKEYNDLKEFWNNAFRIAEDEEIDKDEYLALAPSPKIVEALKELKAKDKILDYGAGNGWASIILSKLGAKSVVSADVVANSKISVDHYAKLFDAKNIDAITIDDEYLSKTNDKYDGIFCSNVLDVLPDDISFGIIKDFSRITNKDSLIIIGLNYYIDLNTFKITKNEKIEGSLLFINNILRLNSKSDEEWINIFNKYFEVIKLEHFSWPGEDKERRRLFYLKKR